MSTPITSDAAPKKPLTYKMRWESGMKSLNSHDTKSIDTIPDISNKEKTSKGRTTSELRVNNLFNSIDSSVLLESHTTKQQLLDSTAQNASDTTTHQLSEAMRGKKQESHTNIVDNVKQALMGRTLAAGLRDPQFITYMEHKLLQSGPKANRGSDHFMHYPIYNYLDIEGWKEQIIINLNLNGWMLTCFPNNVASDTAPTKIAESFHSPFPGQVARDAPTTDLHICNMSGVVKLRFSMEDGLTHRQFCDKYGKTIQHEDAEPEMAEGESGYFNITIAKEAVKKHLRKSMPHVDWDNTPYHFVVFDIQIEHEEANFGTTFEKMLISSIPQTAPFITQEGEKKYQANYRQWSSESGVGVDLVNLPKQKAEGSKASSSESVYYNPIISKTGVPSNKSIYIAPDVVNSADFSRYINRDWDHLFAQIEESRAGHNTLQIWLPNVDVNEGFTFLQWLLFENFYDIAQRTDYNTQPQRRPDATVYGAPKSTNPISWNTVFTAQSSKTDNPYTYIDYSIFMSIVMAIYNKFEQSKYLMNANEIKLLVWPAKGAQGWIDYKHFCDLREGQLDFDIQHVYYNCEISIKYCPYKHSRLPLMLVDTQ